MRKTASGFPVIYLTCVGFAGGLTAILLWPAFILHALLTAFLTLAARRNQEIKT